MMELQFEQVLRNAEGNEVKVKFDITYTEEDGGKFSGRCPVLGCPAKPLESPMSATTVASIMRHHLIVLHDFTLHGGITEGHWRTSEML